MVGHRRRLLARLKKKPQAKLSVSPLPDRSWRHCEPDRSGCRTHANNHLGLDRFRLPALSTVGCSIAEMDCSPAGKLHVLIVHFLGRHRIVFN